MQTSESLFHIFNYTFSMEIIITTFFGFILDNTRSFDKDSLKKNEDKVATVSIIHMF